MSVTETDEASVGLPQPPMSPVDRRSVCQSPSWEAYGRRKKEKKEKVLADKEEKARKRRLSKPPPHTVSAITIPTSTTSSSNIHATPHGLSQSSSPIIDSRRPRTNASNRPRPSSALCTATSDLPGSTPTPIPTPPTSRSRSGSLSSLFRSGRRSSVDNSNDYHFIGGIKLEQHRLAANQQMLNEHAVLSEGDIHPVFRSSRRSPSPLRFLSSKHEHKEAKQRQYPPISIKTSSRNQGLLAPEPSTSATDNTMKKKWRDRFGNKTSKPVAADEKNATRESERQPNPKVAPAPADGRDQVSGRHSVDAIPTACPKIKERKSSSRGRRDATISYAKRPSSTSPADSECWQTEYFIPPFFGSKPNLDLKTGLTGDWERRSINSSHSQSDDSQPSFKTAPGSPQHSPKPAPPRRSSKRKSVTEASDSSICVFDAPEIHRRDFLPTAMKSVGKDKNATVSFSLPDEEQSQKLHQIHRKPVSTQPPTITREVSQEVNRQINGSRLSTPPSIQYESLVTAPDTSTTGKRTLRNAAKSVFAPPPQPPSSLSFGDSTSKRGSYNHAIGANGRSRPESMSSNNLQAKNFSRPNMVPQSRSQSQNWKTTNLAPISPPTSDDSFSDGQISTPSTPDTSRPQSESDKGASDGGMHKQSSTARYNAPSPTFSFAPGLDDNLEKEAATVDNGNSVQHAAIKVMAAFSDGPLKRPTPRGRSSYDPSLAALLPQLKNPAMHSKDGSKSRSRSPSQPPVSKASLPLKDLIMSKDESSASSPWPASYLEKARKAAPSAPAPPLRRQNPSSSTASLTKNSSSRLHQPSPSKSNLSLPKQSHVTPAVGGDPVAKMFVECCTCHYYHDMPSKLYEAMANPEGAVVLGQHLESGGKVTMAVRCPWCKHEMSTRCCAGYAAMVYVKEKLH